MKIRMVGGWMFLLVPAHPGSPGQRAVKRLLLLLFLCVILVWCCWGHPVASEVIRRAYVVILTRIWADANVLTALPNIGGALCWMLLSKLRKCCSGAVWGRKNGAPFSAPSDLSYKITAHSDILSKVPRDSILLPWRSEYSGHNNQVKYRSSIRTLLAHVGPRYCTRDMMVKRCFRILDTDHHDWMSFAFLPNHAIYQSVCARYTQPRLHCAAGFAGSVTHSVVIIAPRMKLWE